MPRRSKVAVGDWLTRPSTVVALVLVVVGLLFALVEAQSPSKLYWTGDAVAATNSGGIAYYRVHGQQYTLDVPGPAPAHDTPVTVFVDPGDPSQALLSRPTRWVDAAAVLCWFVAAVALVAVAALRRSSRRRQRPDDMSESAWIAEYLERSRRQEPRPRRP
jgi:hypothetical protein